ncbi:hypothetical protein [Aquamicrobium soli]|jgi:hypothetical protein|uniref:Pilus assembly protein n=1 Tax=Aquamicrobium soli TaxID=1811518 RepID=A0ABV7K6N7_9HYPH
MMASFPRNSLLVLLAAMLLGGCADYMNHRDSITLGAGDAMEANLGIHTIKSFPPDAKNTNIRVDGAKVQQAYKRYIEPCDQQVVTCTDSASGPAISITNNMPGTEPAQ